MQPDTALPSGDPGSEQTRRLQQINRLYAEFAEMEAGQAESEAIRERERRLFESVVMTIPDLVWLKDPDGVYLFCNPAFERFFGARREEIVGKTDYDFVDQELADFFRSKDQEALAAGLPTRNDEWITYADDGRHALMETVKTPLVDGSGQISGILGIARDVTDTRRAATLEKHWRELALTQTIAKMGGWSADLLSGMSINSPAASRINGMPTHEVPTETYFAIIDQADLPRCRQAFEDTLATGKPYDVEHRITVDGRRKWVHSIAELEYDAGRPVRLYGMIQDITDRKRTEGLLQREQERLAGIIYGANVGTWEWQVQTGTCVLNERWAEMIGYTLAELEPVSFHTWEEHAHPDDLKRSSELFARHVSGELPSYECECRMRHKLGHWVWVLDRGKVVLWDADGRPLLVSGTHLDITKRKLAEEALGASERFMRLLTDYIPGMVGYWTNDLLCGFANIAYQEWFGKTPEQLVGMHLGELLGAELYRANEPFIHAVLRGERQRFESTMTKADGHIGYTLVHYIPDWDRVQVRGFFVLVSDVTDLKLTQMLLEQANRSLAQRTSEAEAANRAKSEFLANMSHEIRTPMNAIIGLGRLALKTELSSHQREYLTNMTAAADSLLRLLNDLLDFSKIEAGKLLLARITFPLRPSMTQLINLIECNADEKGLKISVTIDPETPEYLVGDLFRLRQVLINLLNNSVKFTLQGEVTLAVRRLPDSGDEEVLLEFVVRDTGIGMTPDQIDAVFEPFIQGEGSTTRTYGGTGLGLSICRRLVTLLGGDITVASEPGQGSAFTFTARFIRGNAADIPPEKPAPSRSAVGSLQGRHVLVAEDQTINQQVIREVLEQAEMVVTIVAHGGDAVATVATTRFDAVLMDIRMPIMDGYEATRLIRQQPEYHDLPIIALTANAMWEERNRCFDAGMNDHLSKPIDADQVIETLARWLVPCPDVDSAPAASKECHLEEKSTLASLPGFNLKSALKRLRGNQRLLFTLLRDFADTQGGAVAAIRTALEDGDPELARHLVHALRGNAGNLSAGPVAMAAGVLEEALRNGVVSDVGNLLEQLDQTLRQALEGMSSLLGNMVIDAEHVTDYVGDRPVDVAKLAPRLSRLYGLLTKNSMQARKQLVEVTDLLQGTRLEEESRRIEVSLAKFDFKYARTVVENLALSLDVELP